MKAVDPSFMAPIELPSLESMGQKSAFDALRFFDLHKDWIEGNRDLASKYFHKISLVRLPEHASRIYSSLRASFPFLFPVIFAYEKIEVEVPENLLVSKNPFISTSRKFLMDNRVKFFPDAMSESLFKILTEYFADKPIVIDGENAIELYQLAERYETRSLAVKCATFISDHLDDVPTLMTILNAAVKNKWKDLIWACLIAIQKNEMQIDKSLTTHSSSPEIPEDSNEWQVTEALSIGVSGLRTGTYFDFSSFGFRYVIRTKPFILDKTFIEQVNALVSIEAFKGDHTTTQEMLDQLDFLNLSELQLKLCPIKRIPKKWLDNLSHLEWFGFSFEEQIEPHMLKNISVPNAIKINLVKCERIQSIHAPNAITFRSFDCSYLKNIFVPNATSIECRIGYRIQNIEAPNATSIILHSHFWELLSIEMSKAETVGIYDCNKLQDVIAPNATTIELAECQKLQSVHAQNATTIQLTKINNLKHLEGQNATTFECERCEKLESILMPKATTLKCLFCSALQSVFAPIATTIEYGYCLMLPSIDAPNATTIECHLCTNLQRIFAPNAKTIKIWGEQKLCEITAPKGCIIMSGQKIDFLGITDRTIIEGCRTFFVYIV